MEFKYEVTEEDMIKGTLYNVKNSPERKKSYNRARYLLPAMAGFLLFNFNKITSVDNKLFWAVFAILFVLIWIIRFPKSYEKQIRKMMKKIKKDKGTTYIVYKETMIVEENNIKIISENSSNEISTAEIKKDSIKKVKVYDDMILIYNNSFDPHIVSTRNLTKESKIELLKKLGYE